MLKYNLSPELGQTDEEYQCIHISGNIFRNPPNNPRHHYSSASNNLQLWDINKSRSDASLPLPSHRLFFTKLPSQSTSISDHTIWPYSSRFILIILIPHPILLPACPVLHLCFLCLTRSPLQTGYRY